MIKAIFWDNDGVLVDTEELYYQATREILASVDVALTPEQYRELFLLQGRGAWHLVSERGATSEQVEALRDRRNALYSQWLIEEPRVIPGVADTLERLRGQYVMGVVTSSRRDHFDLIHQKSGLLSYFDFILTASDVARVKPDPELYRKAVERSGHPPEACVAIEDSERGLAAAKGAGIRCVVVPTALTKDSVFSSADRVVPLARDVPGVVRELY